MNFTNFKFDQNGLIPAIVQEAGEGNGAPAGRVLMMAWMNREAVEKCLASGKMHYWSRSRQKSWLKGESSGHFQKIKRWFIDCDGDTLLFEVEQEGGACHTGHASCFFQELGKDGERLAVTESRVFDPNLVYSK